MQPCSSDEPINVNVDEIRNIVSVSIRRTSAFLRFGLDELNTRDGGNFNLAAGVNYQFWPEVITTDERNDARDAYRSWLVGCGLRELDQYYSIFLDKVWWAIEVGEKHGTALPAGFKFDAKFAELTNVAEKQKRVTKKLGSHNFSEELKSLSKARNCLAHNTGMVRSPNDCNNAALDTLEIKWLAFDMLAIRGGKERIIDKLPFDTNELPGEGDTKVAVRFGQRVLAFPAGTRVNLTLSQIAEFCVFYNNMAEKTIEGLLNFFLSKGLIASVGDPTAAEPEQTPGPM